MSSSTADVMSYPTSTSDTTTTHTSSALTISDRISACLLMKQNMRVQLDKGYQMTKEESAFLNRCNSATSILPYVIFAFISYSRSMQRGGIPAVGAAFTLWLGIEAGTEYRCVNNFTSQPTFPLAVDNRRVLRHRYPQHHILQRLDRSQTGNPDMLAPPLQYSKAAASDNSKHGGDGRDRARVEAGKSSSQQQAQLDKFTNNATEVARNATSQPPTAVVTGNTNNSTATVQSQRLRQMTPSVMPEMLSRNMDSEFTTDATGNMSANGITFGNDAVTPTPSRPPPAAVRASRDSEQPQRDLSDTTRRRQTVHNDDTQTDGQLQQQHQPQQQHSNTAKPNSWDKIRQQAHEPHTAPTDTYTKRRQDLQRFLRDQRTEIDSTQVEAQNLFIPESQSADYDTSARGRLDEQLSLGVSPERTAERDKLKQKRQERKYKQFRPFGQRDELLIDFTAPAKG